MQLHGRRRHRPDLSAQAEVRSLQVRGEPHVQPSVEVEGLLVQVAKVGERLQNGIEAIGDPLVDHVRGAGLLLGIVLNEPVAAQIQAAAQRAGFLVNAAVADTVRLAPPLILTERDADTFLAVLPGILRSVREAD